jgi:hypothetical protein
LQKSLTRAAAVTGLALAAGLPFLGSAQAATSTEVVTQADVTELAENTPPTDNWVEYFRTAASEATFEDGPAVPPLGTGSVELSTPTSGDKVTVFNYDHVGTPLSAVDEIGYSTFRSSGSLQQVAALNIQVDANGTATAGGFTTLVFEPVYNTGQGTVVDGTWQDWDAYAGGDAIWWSSNAIGAAPNRDTFVSWDTIVAANPDAVVVGGIGVNQGSGNAALVTNVDALAFGHDGDTTVYDFERILDADGDGIPDTPAPTDADQCKKGGYASFNNPSFRNQGQCVSYANGRR